MSKIEKSPIEAKGTAAPKSGGSILRIECVKSSTGLKEIIDTARDLLDQNAAASAIGVSPGTLSVWRSTGRYGLPFIKVGRNVRYRRSDLESWLQSRCRESGATA